MVILSYYNLNMILYLEEALKSNVLLDISIYAKYFI